MHSLTHFYEMQGYDHAVYNVYAVVHLADDASQFGLIENISSFPYEYFLHKFKRLIRKPEFPLQQVMKETRRGGIQTIQQIIRRLSEENQERRNPNNSTVIRRH